MPPALGSGRPLTCVIEVQQLRRRPPLQNIRGISKPPHYSLAENSWATVPPRVYRRSHWMNQNPDTS